MKIVSRTFRLNSESDKILVEESKRHGLSVSALLNQIIFQYTLISRYSEKVPRINMSYQTFCPLLDHIADEDLIKEAKKAGSILPLEALLQRGKNVNHESVISLIDAVYGQYGNWYESNYSTIDGFERFHLTHQLNQKWSTFLANFFSSMFQTLLDLPVKTEIRTNSVTIYVPKKTF